VILFLSWSVTCSVPEDFEGPQAFNAYAEGLRTVGAPSSAGLAVVDRRIV